jgi:hypothetical protein
MFVLPVEYKIWLAMSPPDDRALAAPGTYEVVLAVPPEDAPGLMTPPVGGKAARGTLGVAARDGTWRMG